MESKQTAAVRRRLESLKSERETAITVDGTYEDDREIRNLDGMIRVNELELAECERRDRDIERRRTETEALSAEQVATRVRSQRGQVNRVRGVNTGIAVDGVWGQ